MDFCSQSWNFTKVDFKMFLICKFFAIAKKLRTEIPVKRTECKINKRDGDGKLRNGHGKVMQLHKKTRKLHGKIFCQVCGNPAYPYIPTKPGCFLMLCVQ